MSTVSFDCPFATTIFYLLLSSSGKFHRNNKQCCFSKLSRFLEACHGTRWTTLKRRFAFKASIKLEVSMEIVPAVGNWKHLLRILVACAEISVWHTETGVPRWFADFASCALTKNARVLTLRNVRNTKCLPWHHEGCPNTILRVKSGKNFIYLRASSPKDFRITWTVTTSSVFYICSIEVCRVSAVLDRRIKATCADFTTLTAVRRIHDELSSLIRSTSAST